MHVKEVIAGLFILVCSAIAGDLTGSSLHYYVIDKSGSIADRKLTDEIVAALKNDVNQLGEHDEVRIVFFNHKASGHAVWPAMTFDAKAEFALHVSKNMAPKGQTDFLTRLQRCSVRQRRTPTDMIR